MSNTESLGAAIPNTLRFLAFNGDEFTFVRTAIDLIIHEREVRTESHLVNENDQLIPFWSTLFTIVFLNPQVKLVDDLLFFVHEYHDSNRKPEVKVFRTNSPNLPRPTDNGIHWEETVYLNLLMQFFTYVVTVAVYTRTGPQEWQILRKFSQTVHASPSCRKMHNKGNQVEIDYPNIFFAIDNFEEVFSECVIQDSECLGVELTAYDRAGHLHGVCFLGTITYDTLAKFYNTQHKFKLWSKSITKRGNELSHRDEEGSKTKFMRVIGPEAKGSVELAITPILQSNSVLFESSKTNDAPTTSFLLTGCCDRISLSKSAAQLDSMDDWLEKHPYQLNDDHLDESVNKDTMTAVDQTITTQPTLKPNISYANNPMISNDMNHTSNESDAENVLNTIPTLYPTPLSIKSAGASVDTSPVRRTRFGVCRKSANQSHTGATMRNIHDNGSRRTSNSDRILEDTKKSSKITEILNTYTGTGDTHHFTKPTKSKMYLQNPNGSYHKFVKKPYWFQSVMRFNSIEDFPGLNKGDPSSPLNESSLIGTDSSKSSFRQSWSWFSERRRLTSLRMNACPTFITLPCESILLDLLEVKRGPILNFSNQV